MALELAPQNYYNPFQGRQLFDPANPFVYNVGGGMDQAVLALQALQFAQAAELGRRQFGQGLLDTLIKTQQDPFSIVPALQMYKSAGGGTLAPNVAFSRTGGAGAPSPYGPLMDKLLTDLSTFALTKEAK